MQQPPFAQRVAGFGADLEHVGAEFGEHPARERPGDQLAEFQHADAVQGRVMAVSNEIVVSMKAIMTAFAPGENRSMLNQPFRFGKARVALLMHALRQPFHPGKRARATGKRRHVRRRQNRTRSAPAGRLSARPAMFSASSPRRSCFSTARRCRRTPC